jgi:hypothetical protein
MVVNHGVLFKGNDTNLSLACPTLKFHHSLANDVNKGYMIYLATNKN